MFAKLFTTGEGKIPFVQIALGVIVGAIGMLIYARFYKPKILFPEQSAPQLRRAAPAVAAKPLGKRKDSGNGGPSVTIAEHQQQRGYEADDALVGAPVILDLGILQTGSGVGLRAPELPLPAAMFPPEDAGDEDADDDEDEIDEDEDEVEGLTGPSGLTEL